MSTKKKTQELKKFSHSICDRIGYYVYALVNPKTKKIFYIGKGKSNRIFDHVNDALKKANKSDKLDIIRDIIKSGNEVEHYIIRYELEEDEAKKIESVCIDVLGFDKLTNKQHGVGFFERTHTDEIIKEYNKDTVKISSQHPTIIIRINKYYWNDMSAAELYRITRRCWKVNENRNKAQYAMAVFHGIIKEVYEINKWEPAKNNSKERWEFVGKPAKNSIRKKYIGKALHPEYTKKGNANPIMYSWNKEIEPQ